MVKFKKEFSYIGGKFEIGELYRSKWFEGYLIVYMFESGEDHMRFNSLDIEKYIEGEY